MHIWFSGRSGPEMKLWLSAASPLLLLISWVLLEPAGLRLWKPYILWTACNVRCGVLAYILKVSQLLFPSLYVLMYFQHFIITLSAVWGLNGLFFLLSLFLDETLWKVTRRFTSSRFEAHFSIKIQSEMLRTFWKSLYLVRKKHLDVKSHIFQDCTIFSIIINII